MKRRQQQLPVKEPEKKVKQEESEEESNNIENFSEEENDDQQNQRSQTGYFYEMFYQFLIIGKSKARHDNSLSVLTQKFVELIKKNENFTIDLNDAVRELNVQKRRIYDITNVLEGIGYVEKISKNKIKWVGATDDPELETELSNLRKEIAEQEEEEKTIDHWIDYLQQKLNDNFLKNPNISKYTYLTHEDFKELSKIQQQENKGEALFIITAPKGTSVESPFNENQNAEFPYQLYLNSTNADCSQGNQEISVYICSDENYPIEYEKKK